MKHSTTSLVVKVVDVDDNILPVVRWLNEQQETTTLFSCEGYEGELGSAYVLFSCFSFKVLDQIADVLAKQRDITTDLIVVSGHPTSPFVRFNLSFRTLKDRDAFNQLLGPKYGSTMTGF